jgi:hypothetical protein
MTLANWRTWRLPGELAFIPSTYHLLAKSASYNWNHSLRRTYSVILLLTVRLSRGLLVIYEFHYNNNSTENTRKGGEPHGTGTTATD